jgi:DNA-binding SARP family transcriptional activator
VAGAIGETNYSDMAHAVAAARPRVLTLAAPAGYGKGTFLRSYAAHAGRIVVCSLAVGDSADLVNPLLRALVAGDRRRSTRSAASRLAQRRETVASTSREALRREWPVTRGAELFVLRDPAAVLATPAGAELLAELVGTLPTTRTLAVAARAALPSALQQIVAAEPTVMLGPTELRLGQGAVHELACAAGIDPAVADDVYALAAGWPLVTRLLLELLRWPPQRELLAAAAALPTEALLRFVVHRTVARLEQPVREALVVAALRPRVEHEDIVRVLGDSCDDLVFLRLAELPFVIGDGPRVVVHPEVAELVRARYQPLYKTLYERTLYVLTGDGAYVEAARVALDNGDAVRAAAMIDAAPPYTAAPIPLAEYERIIDRIDRGLITRYPNLWVATIPSRAFAVDRTTFTREAETVYYCLSGAAHPDQRAAVLMLLANAYIAVGRIAEADALVDRALSGFAREPLPARAALLAFSASVRGIEGRFELSRALASEAAAISRDTFSENQALHYVDAHEAGYAGKMDRVVVIIDELLRRRAEEDLPLYVAHAATSGAFFAWANGDDATFERYLALCEEALTPGLDAGFAPTNDAARGRPALAGDTSTWPAWNALTELYRLGHATDRAATMIAARAAADHADLRRDPYLQILSHAALFVLDETTRERETAVLTALVATFEVPEMRAAVGALVRGEPPGILTAFVQRRVLHAGATECERSQLVVELLLGRVTRDGVALRLTEKEFELLAFLASTPGLVSRDRIGEALWDHLDPQEWPNNLKVTLSRVRAKLGLREAVLAMANGYRLSPLLDVDIRRADAVLREHRSRPLDDAARGVLRDAALGYQSNAGARYERFTWAQPLLARVGDVVCEAGIALANDALARRRYDDALAYARGVSAADPFSEAACAAAIRALLGRGDGDAARRELARYTAALVDELGARPSMQLVQLTGDRS